MTKKLTEGRVKKGGINQEPLTPKKKIKPPPQKKETKKMPGNTVKINDSDLYEWYVGDSKIDDVVAYLDSKGERIRVVTECSDEEETNKKENG